MHKGLQRTIIAMAIMLILSLAMPTTAYAASNQTKIKSIQKARPTITMTATDTKVTVKVKAVKYATKYQVRYATNKNFKSAKTVTTTSKI